MEKLSFVKNGVPRLPPGFRFHPTDEELVVQYLMRKVLSHPLPASIIPEVDLCKSDPWDLPGDSDQERYFFSNREAKYPNGNRSNRATGSGYWKATGLDKPIVSSKINQVVGVKKTLVFYRGKPPKGSRTDWVMHEYSLCSTNPQQFKKEDWVLCRIFLKKRNSQKNGVAKEAETGLVFYDFMAKERAADFNDINNNDNSCSGASGITSEISNKNGTSDDPEEEENSSFDRFNIKCAVTRK